MNIPPNNEYPAQQPPQTTTGPSYAPPPQSYPYYQQQPQQPYGPPPVPPPPAPPKRKYPLWLWAVCIIIAIGIIGAAIQNMGNPNPNTTTASQPTATSPAKQQQPTATTAPRPTPTPKPVSPQEALASIAQDQVLSHKATVTISGGVVTVNADASDNLTDKMVAEGTQIDIYNVMKNFWTSGKLPKNITEVKVIMNGGVQDAYGKASTAPWASATLVKGDEEKFVWDNLTWKSAWDVYSTTYMIENLQSALVS